MTDKVQVIVKTVTNDQYTYFISSKASILDLKLLIKEDYLGNPVPEAQKIIIGGTVREDNAIIEDLFKQMHLDLESPLNCHLIVKSILRSSTDNPRTHAFPPINPNENEQHNERRPQFEQPPPQDEAPPHREGEEGVRQGQDSDFVNYQTMGVIFIGFIIYKLRDSSLVTGITQRDWRNETGVIGEILRFIVPFFLSLYPNWEPVKHRPEQEEADLLDPQDDEE